MSGDPLQPNKFGSDLSGPPPERRSRLGCILAVVAIVAVSSMVLCCGGGGLMTWWAMRTGMQEMGQMMVAQLRDDPTVREHLGEIQRAEWDLWATQRAIEELDEPAMVYNLHGTQGRGELIVFGDQPHRAERAILRLPDGREFQLELQPTTPGVRIELPDDDE